MVADGSTDGRARRASRRVALATYRQCLPWAAEGDEHCPNSHERNINSNLLGLHALSPFSSIFHSFFFSLKTNPREGKGQRVRESWVADP